MADNYFDFVGQNAGEEKKEVPQETQAMANVTVRADADCFLLCDGEYLDIQLDAGKMTKIQVPIGQHLLEFLYTEDPDIKVEKEVDFPEAGKSYLVIIKELKAAVDNVAAEAKAKEEAKRKAEEEAKRQAEEAKRQAEELANSEPYAVYENGTLTFYFDTQKSNRGGMGFEIVQYDGDEGYKWHEHKEKIKTVIFDESFSNCHCIGSTYSWFCKLEELTLIRGLNNLDTSKVTDMVDMFYGCSSLKSIDVSRFDTSNVTNMCGMFSGCSSLQSIDVSRFDTSKVTSMGCMFYGCSSLKSIDVSRFDTSNVTNMSGMFQWCSSLQVLDVSDFDTSNVTNMRGMFMCCSSLQSLDLSRFDTSNVTDMGYMFNHCSSLQSLDLSRFDTRNVTDMSCMFQWCSSLKSLDLSGFDTSNVEDMSGMFGGIDDSKIKGWE